jgi:hypothetical protein
MNKEYTIGVIVIMTLIALGTTTLAILAAESAYGIRVEGGSFGVVNHEEQVSKAPIATSGDNVYIAWWTNKTGNNNEVMFRASTDKGQTFGDKINLSNTPTAESTRVEIDSDANSVVVTWWETNQTASIPVMKISTDNGKTFGPMLNLSTNGTINSS